MLWLTSGLSCDGESVSLTAATSPSLEELLRGAIPGQPRIVLYNPLLAYDVGDDYLRAWHAAARGELDPFVLVVEGSVPNEEINGEGHWCGFGVDGEGQPITSTTWIDRLAPRAAVVHRARHVRRVRRRSCDAQQPDRRDGARATTSATGSSRDAGRR